MPRLSNIGVTDGDCPVELKSSRFNQSAIWFIFVFKYCAFLSVLCLLSLFISSVVLVNKEFHAIRDYTVSSVSWNMGDDVALNVRLYVPSVTGRKWPVLLLYRTLPEFGSALESDAKTAYYFVRRGFMVVQVDGRGTGASEGVLPPIDSDQLVRDGLSVLRLAAAHPASTGSVALCARGVDATNALRIAQLKPLELRALVLLDVDRSSQAYSDMYADYATRLGADLMHVEHDYALPPLPDYLSSDDSRANLPSYIQTLLAHRDYDAFWSNATLPDLSGLQVPVYLIGSLYHDHRNAVVDLYERLNAHYATIRSVAADPTNLLYHLALDARRQLINLDNLKVKVVMGPFAHGWPEDSPPVGSEAVYDGRLDVLLFLKQFLLLQNNGFLREPDWSVFVPSGGISNPLAGLWRYESWPIQRQASNIYYLTSDHSASDTLTVDHLPTPYLIQDAQALDQTDDFGFGLGLGDAQRLLDARWLQAYTRTTFTSRPLSTKLSVIGRVFLSLNLKASVNFDDLLVLLVDRNSNGQSTFVTSAMLASAFVAPLPINEQGSRIVQIHLRFTAWTFEAQHTIQIIFVNHALSASLFNLHPIETSAPFTSHLILNHPSTYFTLPVDQARPVQRSIVPYFTLKAPDHTRQDYRALVHTMPLRGLDGLHKYKQPSPASLLNLDQVVETTPDPSSPSQSNQGETTPVTVTGPSPSQSNQGETTPVAGADQSNANHLFSHTRAQIGFHLNAFHLRIVRTQFEFDFQSPRTLKWSSVVSHLVVPHIKDLPLVENPSSGLHHLVRNFTHLLSNEVVIDPSIPDYQLPSQRIKFETFVNVSSSLVNGQPITKVKHSRTIAQL